MESEPGKARGGTMLDYLRRMEAPPVARLVGLERVSVEPGEAVFELAVEERHANPMGTVHGGILCDLADAAMGVAFASLMEVGETYTTLELKINYLKPVWRARLKATGRVIRRGKTVGLVACEVTDGEGALVAYATSTCMLLSGEPARGR
jgi:uncharacterized protein (TIGR00369 family)